MRFSFPSTLQGERTQLFSRELEQDYQIIAFVMMKEGKVMVEAASSTNLTLLA